jgi:hypothetical protein
MRWVWLLVALAACGDPDGAGGSRSPSARNAELVLDPSPAPIARPGHLPSAIERENAHLGTEHWRIERPAEAHEIEGFASATSVDVGGSIDLFVSTAEPSYTIEIFRLGWYQGRGARHVFGPITRHGVLQPQPMHDPKLNLVECLWSDPYRMRIEPNHDLAWTSGVYVAKLTASQSQKESFIIFVVRRDGAPADFLFQSSAATFQTYNNWGGYSAYASNSMNHQAARMVSFNRPYARGRGAGDFFEWEYDTVRFLEREGYDVTYATSVDLDANPKLLDKDRVFISAGHDEYWSYAQRGQVEAALAAGTSLMFLSANAMYWQIRYEPSAIDGAERRTIVAYKEIADLHDPDAASSATSAFTTTQWRDPLLDRPESTIIGVQYNGYWPVEGDVVIDDAKSWVFEGTGLRHGDVLKGLLGYETDWMTPDSPKEIVRLGHSPTASALRWSDMTLYTAKSGAMVFAAGESWRSG